MMKNSSKEPYVSTYVDNEEQELIEAIATADHTPSQSQLTPEFIQNIQQAARNTINAPTAPVSIRLPKTDLARVKAQALRQGIPYQTLIKSIIHEAAYR